MTQLTVGNVTVDCENAAELARFYAELLGGAVDDGATEFFATVGRAAGAKPVLMFIKVPDRTAGKNSIHLDLHAPDVASEVERAVGLGAKHVADFAEYGVVWTTLADPEGNLFDIGDGGEGS
ncbi:VOC family protein [Frankia sp. CNm7]|uniref:VOC family protein n=1 Tax=Frankia nepalensis TaxID=1836974 RepID=A0A937RH22_9ACTN|nr:VOC family protein [Frankia nepalensis]MBL7495596.1 VOC family protein [Frankia nepalensis]MBL7508842.1 VOC family protein [Frankia nepalensis]MBL7522111.1 VOC family protein [Frankia nepalensis]MBL7630067.1 VOC family protein [Frankia nepalensis]